MTHVDDERRAMQMMASQFGGPAFLRRAGEVQAAYDRLLDHCRARRGEMLAMVRLRLATLHALAGSWEALRPMLDTEAGLADAALDALRRMHGELMPVLRIPIAATLKPAPLRRALGDLREAIVHFNERWRTFIARLDLAHVNRLRDGYNRYYVLEKECAVGSPRVARQGFRRLEMLTHEEMLRHFPVMETV